jgi:hypothetical protein
MCSFEIKLDSFVIITALLLREILNKLIRKHHQHVSCPTRGNNVLDHVYTNICDMYKTIPRTHFCQLDCVSLSQLPAYKQHLKREPPTPRIVRRWTEGADLMLQDCSVNTD